MNALFLMLTLAVAAMTGLAQEISTGPGLPRSESRSTYFRGMVNDSTIAPARLRVMGVNESAEGELRAEVIVLDAEGNILPISLDRMPMSAEVVCRGSSPSAHTVRIGNTVDASTTPPAVHLYMLCDNSMLSGTLARDVVLSLQRNFADAIGDDQLGLGLFNQSFSTILPMGSFARLNSDLQVADLPPADGLSSLYAATQNACRMLASASGKRALILVTATPDNATPFSTTMDVVRMARDAKIPVFVVRVGLEASGQPLRYISSATGGRMYTLQEDETSAIGDIVREVLYAQKWSTEVVVQADVQDFVNCETPWLRLKLDGNPSPFPVIDSISLTPLDLTLETSPAVVALFRDTTDRDLRDFYQSLLVISEVLTQNAAMTIELTGHVSRDVGASSDARALERANQVRSFLIANGVLAKQIVVRSEGSRKPRYYFQTDGTRRLLNNRVEARLLVNGSNTHNITVEQVDNEQTAMLRMKLWKDRNLNAFFEPVLEDGVTRYRIKLWGFATLAEAKSVVTKIKRFKPSYSIVE